ncbi:MAG: lamin tail domain-containing protein [Alphaproteobacteria bacterium]|nr:lamin tail domain-containing protein [Alphaproteobacteria bacterium]
MTRFLSLVGLLAPLALMGCGEKDVTDDSTATDDSATDDTGTTTDDSATDDSATDDSATDDSATDDSATDDSGQTEDSVIAQVQRGEIAVGETVTITGWAAHDGTQYGVHVLDGRSDTYAGVYVYWGGIPEDEEGNQDLPVVTRGDAVSITGVVGEYPEEETDTLLSLTQVQVVDAATVTVTGSGGTLPAPVVVTPADLATPETAEMYEGVLVRFENVAVTNPDLGYGEWEVDGSFRIDDLLYAHSPAVVQDATFTAITGHVYYSYGDFKLLPRDANDFEGYAPPPCPSDKCVADLLAGDLVVTEFMPNPSGDIGNDDVNEWVEIYNASGGSVNLAGLIVQDDGGNQATVSDPVEVPAASYFVVAAGDGSNFGYATFAPVAFYGTLALGNGGDQIWLKRAGDEADEDAIDVAAPYNDGNSGLAWQLDAAYLSGDTNDDTANWCETSADWAPEIESANYGTPGAANVSCPAQN